MQLLSAYREAFTRAFAEKSYAAAHLFRLEAAANIDTSGCYKVFFCLSGKKTFRISDRSYRCEPGDLFLISPQDWHYFTDFCREEAHERYVFFIHPQFLLRAGTEATDLRSCFLAADKDGNHRLTLTDSQRQQLLSQIHRLTGKPDFGGDILEQAYFLELMVFINRLFLEKSGAAAPPRSGYSEQVMNMIAFIHAHLSEEIGGALLEKQFALSYAHLNRLFKSATGSTLHKYISAQRIVLAKELLLRGQSVTEACYASGFRDYSNFIKVFTRAVGCTPKKYASMF